jgi:hypothetical protein
MMQFDWLSREAFLYIWFVQGGASKYINVIEAFSLAENHCCSEMLRTIFCVRVFSVVSGVIFKSTDTNKLPVTRNNKKIRLK